MTIVMLLILAGITINTVVGDKGLISRADAKVQMEIANEKEIVARAQMLTVIRSKDTEISYEIFEPALQEEAGGNNVEASDAGDIIDVLFPDTNRYYEVDKNGNITGPNEVVNDENAGDITKGGRCDGSQEKPYEISYIEDFVVLANIVNCEGVRIESGKVINVTKDDKKNIEGKNFVLTRNLNFKSKYSYADSTRTDFGNINGDETDENTLITEMTTGTGFTSIGYNNTSRFYGNFDGKNNSINNIFINNINRTVRDGAEGLFGVIENSKITNLKINGVIDGGTQIAGGIVGEVYGRCNIINCTNSCNVKGCSGVGGIIGRVYGSNENKIIANCYNAGIICNYEPYADYAGVGGIIGNSTAYTYVINCYNEGNVTNNSKKMYAGAGGIIGSTGNNKAYIWNCCNIANVSGKYEEGSMIGAYWYSNWISDIKNCYYLKGTAKYVIGKEKTTQEYDATEYTEQKMKSVELVYKLNEYVMTYNKENKDNEDFIELKYWEEHNNEYPTFKN